MEKYKTFEELKEELGDKFEEYMYQANIELLQIKDKAIEYIKASMNNPQPFYEYLYGDENGSVENLDKLLNILKGEDKEDVKRD